MSIVNLHKLFRPHSVAVIGASNKPQRVGTVVMRNLLESGFDGPIMPVNPKSESISGVLAYPDIASLPRTPDLAVICTPAATVPQAIEELGARGNRAVVCITAGLKTTTLDDGRNALEAVLETASRYRMRILGPNCLGMIVPGRGLNASFSHVPARPGKIAFVSQSGGLATAVLDWASTKGVGFSHVVSLGDAANIDFDDLLDYLASDRATNAILLYIESIHERRNFMSAARAAARIKPVIVIKSGRGEAGAKAAASHTGALAGSDDVYDSAIRRAGMLRVYDFHELFAAVETLAHSRPLKGDRLAILTNGGGPGVLAVDTLIEEGGKLAELSEETIAKLDAVLPSTWSRSNPVDIIGDAPGERYAEAMRILTKASEVDAVLVMHVPTAIASSKDAADAVVEVFQNLPKHGAPNVLSNWLGESGVQDSRDLFSEHGIPSYRTPESAVRAFMHQVQYRRNQVLLMETPASAPSEFTPAVETARLVVENALSQGGGILNEAESKAILAAFGIKTVATRVATSPDEAAELGTMLGFPVALKILSDDISHKSNVGGVVLNLNNAEEVRNAGVAMLERVKATFPEARVRGFTVQQMATRKHAHELIVGATTDPVFGPVILFGHGGTAVEVIGDRAVALPPLNMNLAREMIESTRVYKLLRGYRDQPAADLDAVSLALMQVAQIVIDLPEVVELDINPLLATPEGVIALDARVRVKHSSLRAGEHLAIRPYPKELEESYTLTNGRKVLLRPIRPEDEEAHHEFISKLDPQDKYFRFFGVVREFQHSDMARLTQIDYDREMAFIATAPGDQGKPETLAVVRAMNDVNNEKTEFAIVVRSDLHGQSLGRKLMDKIIGYCRQRGVREFTGCAMAENTHMISLAKYCGMTTTRNLEDHTVSFHLDLTAAAKKSLDKAS